MKTVPLPPLATDVHVLIPRAWLGQSPASRYGGVLEATGKKNGAGIGSGMNGEN